MNYLFYFFFSGHASFQILDLSGEFKKHIHFILYNKILRVHFEFF